MFYGNIKNCDIANGVGVRISLFVSGCRHHCKNCFQPCTWNFKYGREFTEDTINEILSMLKPNYISGLTLLGGEPFEPENQQDLLWLVERVKKTYPSKNIWAYSGYLYEELTGKKKCELRFNQEKISLTHPRTEFTDKLLSHIDVLVDGEFIDELKDISLNFRGSSNQRIIDLNETRKNGKLVLHSLNN